MKIDIEENTLQNKALDYIHSCRENICDVILQDSSYQGIANAMAEQWGDYINGM